MIRRADWSQPFDVCRDHFMTSVGHTAAYPTAWFTLRQTFLRSEVKRVSWDVNMADLGTRQRWEVMICPAEDAARYRVSK